MPMTSFIDLFIVGEAEAILPDFLNVLRQVDNPRQEIEAFIGLDGVFTPDKMQEKLGWLK